MTEPRTTWATALAASSLSQRGDDSGDMATGGYRAHEAEGNYGHCYWIVIGPPNGREVAIVDSGPWSEADARRIVAALDLAAASADVARHLIGYAAEDGECLLCGQNNPHHDRNCSVPAFLAAVEKARGL